MRVVGVVEADVPLRLAGCMANGHGWASRGKTTERDGGRRGGEGAVRTGIGGDTETKAKGGPGGADGVYKWLRERDQGAEEGDQRSVLAHGACCKLGRCIFVNTRACFPVSRQMQIAHSGGRAPDTSALPRQLSNLPAIEICLPRFDVIALPNADDARPHSSCLSSCHVFAKSSLPILSLLPRPNLLPSPGGRPPPHRTVPHSGFFLAIIVCAGSNRIAINKCTSASRPARAPDGEECSPPPNSWPFIRGNPQRRACRSPPSGNHASLLSRPTPGRCAPTRRRRGCRV